MKGICNFVRTGILLIPENLEERGMLISFSESENETCIEKDENGKRFWIRLNGDRRRAAIPEPIPGPGKEKILPAVIADLEARSEMGREKYGVELHSHNGRDAVMDAYQEALDLVMYLKQALMERKNDRSDFC